jgi:hypothetical protein
MVVRMYHFGSDLGIKPRATRLMANMIPLVMGEIVCVNKRAANTKHTPRKINPAFLFFISVLPYLKCLFMRSKLSSKLCFAPDWKFFASPTAYS